MKRRNLFVKMGLYLFISGAVLFSYQSPAVVRADETATAPSADTQMMASDLLDGKTFVGQIGEKNNETGNDDQFIFQNGTFRSTACDTYGFGEGVYTTASEGDTVKFEAETTSPTDGKMKWMGVVKGNMLEGTSLWYKPKEASPVEHWMKGQLKT